MHWLSLKQANYQLVYLYTGILHSYRHQIEIDLGSSCVSANVFIQQRNNNLLFWTISEISVEVVL